MTIRGTTNLGTTIIPMSDEERLLADLSGRGTKWQWRLVGQRPCTKLMWGKWRDGYPDDPIDGSEWHSWSLSHPKTFDRSIGTVGALERWRWSGRKRMAWIRIVTREVTA